MRNYILKRIVISCVTLLVILFALFILTSFLPGSPFNDERLTPEQISVLRTKYGLDKPVAIRFFRYVVNMLSGDFGTSYAISRNTPITMLLQTRLPVSFRIGGQAVMTGTICGLALGTVAALHHNTLWDTAATVISVICVSIPSYVFGLALSYCFGYKLRWLPMLYQADHPFTSSILPTASLCMFTIASISRFTRTEMLEVLGSDYILFAKSKGVNDSSLIVKHALRNSLIPVITVLAPLIVGLMTGSLVIERIFSIPGIGQLLIEGIQTNDYNVISAIVFLYSLLYIGIMLLVDILYGMIDPRIRTAGAEGGKHG
ncbi:ABC transporter permease [Lacrimispora sp.]|uniref:ABC transporter permease n=1 Tax=Lacrimispora sp. TaxID=2719234 RepID=UPI0028AD2FB4|nr:ABC transporter permease [Lacrimispora sp.]